MDRDRDKLKLRLCEIDKNVEFMAYPRGFEPLTLGLEMRGFVVTNYIELYRFVCLQ